MWPALPASDYYGGSAPPRPDRSTVDPAHRSHWRRDRMGEDRGGSRVHCDSLDGGGARLCPCGIATATPQHFTGASGRTTHESARSSPTSPRQRRATSGRSGTRRSRPASTRFRAGSVLRDFVTPVPRVLLSVTLAEPALSGSASTPRRCQDCSRPPRHLPDQAVLSFTALLRQGQWRWSLTSARINSASRRTGWNPNVFFHVAAAFSFSECAIVIVASKSRHNPWFRSRPPPGPWPAPPAPTADAHRRPGPAAATWSASTRPARTALPGRSTPRSR